MNYRWSKNDRRMMQEVIDYFKMMLKIGYLDEFLDLADERKCPFCKTGMCFSPGRNKKDLCRISKCFNKGCTTTFSIWNNFDVEWQSINCAFPELKSLLRDAIKELEPWGEK